MSQAILDKLKAAVEELDVDAAVEAAKEAVAAQVPLAEAVEKGLAKGINTISDAFDEGEAFIPQLVLAGRAFEEAVAVLSENISEEERKKSSKGKVLIHTVCADIHSIGKNIVGIMLGANGFEVIDLGVDVPVETVVDEAVKNDVDIIMGSALMTTTMPAQREIVELLKERGLENKFITMFGGAPTSKEWCDEIGATAWSDTATDAVNVALELIKKKGA